MSPAPISPSQPDGPGGRRSPAMLHTGYMQIDGRTVPVEIRYNPRARRIIVRVDLTAGSVQIVAPSRQSFAQALSFAKEQKAWIAERLSRVPPPVPFEAGARILYRGVEHVVLHAGRRREPGAPGPVWAVAPTEADGSPEIRVTGDESFVARRVGDWLRQQAREELTARAIFYAEQFGVRPSRITVRDTSSRWGSCAPSRALSFSWRLILAPPHVLDYVAAHEAAHLQEMNHGPRFWALVAQARPDYKVSRRWLERHGPSLHRYGVAVPSASATSAIDGLE